jgi:periplasmic divalent cation tolerance protein
MYAVVLITAPDRESGVKIARRLLEKRLAACVNIAPVSSMYWWEGKIEESSEVLLVVKTTSERLGDLIKEVRAIHPYKVPEIIALPITAGLADYLDWVRRETGA